MESKRLAGSWTRGRFEDRKPVSVVDIGSNSVRLVVYEGATRSPTPLFNEKALCGLGRSVAATGKLEGQAVERALAALARFRALSHQLGAGKPWVMATAAVRDAENGAGFLAEIEKATDAKVMLLSGNREAELAAAGIQSGFHEPDGIVGDLGGGSLELADFTPERLQRSITLPLGGLRLLQRSAGNMARAEKLIDDDLRSIAWVKRGAGRPLYAVGGTWRNIAKLHMEERRYPLHVTHGYRLKAAEAIAFSEVIARGKKLRNTDLGRVSGARREVVPLGALVLSRLVERLGASEVVFSVHGIREGLLYTLLAKGEKARDPLIAFCQDYAVLRSRSPLHGEELCRWTDALFTSPGPAETPEERRLRHAACLLSDISWRAHPDYRGEQSLDVIARAALSGVDHPGRAFLALAVYFRHVGDGGEREGKSDRLFELVSRAGIARARIVGSAVRAVHMLSAGAAGIIGRTPVAYEGDRLVLRIPGELAVLDGERLRKRFAVLAELLGRKAEVRVEA